MKIIKLISIILIPALFACAGQLSNSSHVSTSKEYPPTNVSDILILFDTPTEDFTVIGLVESHGIGLSESKEKERSMQALKTEAASIGANAVIITSSSMEGLSGFEGEPAGEENILNGKAIRFK
jgi:hypothetical protein